MTCAEWVARVGGPPLTLLEPCETWPVLTQEAIGQTFSSSEAQRQRLQRWLAHVHQERPALVPHKDEARERLQQVLATADPMGVEQSVYLPFLLRELGAWGYSEARISNESELHSPHLTFRNEWWSLVGRTKAEGTPVTWQAWRHTVVPPNQWEAGVDPRSYSALRFSWTYGETVKHSPWLLESWGLGSVSKDPRFRAVCGRLNKMVAGQPDALFPLDLEWDGVVWRGLDNTKPLIMLHSNACLSCSDGIGIKMYMYPEVKNADFQGYFTHAWEAGVMPEGFSSTAALRGIVNIERGLLYPPALTRADQWLCVKAHWEPGWDLWAFFVSAEAQHPHRVVVSQPSGALRKFAAHDVEWVRLEGWTRGELRHPQFTLQWVLDQPDITSTRQTLTTFSHGRLKGRWLDQTEVEGVVVLETPDLRPYHERAREILQEVFPQAEELQRLYFDQAYFSATSDVMTSVVIWLLPLLFGIFLLLVVVYLVLVPPQPYPWIRPTHTSWWRRLLGRK